MLRIDGSMLSASCGNNKDRFRRDSVFSYEPIVHCSQGLLCGWRELNARISRAPTRQSMKSAACLFASVT
jgi:hypothetical protein